MKLALLSIGDFRVYLKEIRALGRNMKQEGTLLVTVHEVEPDSGYLSLSICSYRGTSMIFIFGLMKGFLSLSDSSMLRLDQAGNLTYFYLKVKHLSILPETWQVVWYRYY